MHGGVPNLHPHDEFEHPFPVCEARQSIRVQVRPPRFSRLRPLHFFVRRHISNLPQPRGWEKKIAEGPPCVVLASPGFMQTGPSRELFELWAPDSRNGVIMTGYSVDGTLARVRSVWATRLPLFYCY